MKKKIGLYLILAVLYAIPFIAFFLFIWKGDINGQFYDETTSNNVTVVIDTAAVNAPTATSERFLGFDTIRLERADKRADSYDIKEKGEPKRVSQKGEPESEPESECGAGNDAWVSGSDTVAAYGDGVGVAAYGEGMVTDSVEVLLPRVQRRYEDSVCTVWVSGHDPKVDSVWVYNKVVYYPVAREKEAKPPNVVISVGPYVGVGNRGFSYGIAVTVGVPIWSR